MPNTYTIIQGDVETTTNEPYMPAYFLENSFGILGKFIDTGYDYHFVIDLNEHTIKIIEVKD